MSATIARFYDSRLTPGHDLNNEAVLPHVWLGTASIVPGLCLHRWGGQWLARLSIYHGGK